jgi:para-aminobenzoate synthetase
LDAHSPCAGSLGYISFNDTFDLNIVIRTAVLQHDRISIGAGGAIVVQSGEHILGATCCNKGLGALLGRCAVCSVCRPLGGLFEPCVFVHLHLHLPLLAEPAGEYEEMRLKARALLRAVGMCDGTPGPAAVEDE